MDPEPVYSEPPIAKAIYSIIDNAYPVPGKGSAPEADSYPPGPVIVRTDPVAKAADLVQINPRQLLCWRETDGTGLVR